MIPAHDPFVSLLNVAIEAGYHPARGWLTPWQEYQVKQHLYPPDSRVFRASVLRVPYPDRMIRIEWLLRKILLLRRKARRPEFPALGAAVEAWCAANTPKLCAYDEAKLKASIRDAAAFNEVARDKVRREGQRPFTVVGEFRVRDGGRRIEPVGQLPPSRKRAARVPVSRKLREVPRFAAEYERRRSSGEIHGGFDREWIKPDANAPRWLYLLIGQDGALYLGTTNDLRRRLSEHRSGRGGLTTSHKRQRWWLLFAERHRDGFIANCAEAAILKTPMLHDALLARCASRARRLHARFGVPVVYLGLGDAFAAASAAPLPSPVPAAL